MFFYIGTNASRVRIFQKNDKKNKEYKHTSAFVVATRWVLLCLGTNFGGKSVISLRVTEEFSYFSYHCKRVRVPRAKVSMCDAEIADYAVTR